MTLDEMLSKMFEAMEAENYWDTEAYATMALDYINAGKPISFPDSKDELIGLLNEVCEMASQIQKFKNDLIEEIVSFKE